MRKRQLLSSVFALCLCAGNSNAERVIETERFLLLEDGSTVSSVTQSIISNYYDSAPSGQAASGGAILITNGTIDSITSDFSNNYAHSDFRAAGGAISNVDSNIGVIDSVFDGNYTKVSYETQTGDSSSGGGAIYNSGTIDEIKGKFTNNHTDIKVAEMSSVMAMGGAVWNNNSLGNITADFSENSANAGSVNLNSESLSLALALGGGLLNTGTMGDAVGNYTNNKVTTTVGAAIGGGIANAGIMDLNNIGTLGIASNIDGSFTGNRATATAGAAAGGAIGTLLATNGNISGTYENNRTSANAGLAIGGAVGIVAGQTGDISGTYKSNYTHTSLGLAAGGAIANALGNIGNIDGTFENNSVYADTGVAFGGAFASIGNQGDINGTFTNNSVKASLGLGGAVAFLGLDDNLGLTESLGELPPQIGLPKATKITGDFTGNSVEAYAEGLSNLISIMPENGIAVGGAAAFIGLAAYGQETTPVEFVNSNFYNNKVFSDGGNAWGGAIFSNAVKITADGQDSVFKGNTANGKSNALHLQGIDFLNGLIGDQVFSEDAFVTFNTQNDGNVILYDGIDGKNYTVNIDGDGSGKVTFYDNIKNAGHFNIAANGNAHLGKNVTVGTTNYTSDNGTLTLDIEVDNKGKAIKNAVITAGGDLVGNTKVIINSENRLGYDNASTIFVKAEEDDISTESNFEVTRVIGSPYMWSAENNYGGETDGSTWYLVKGDEQNKDFGFTPEAIASIALPSAAIAQTNGMVYNIMRKVNMNRLYCPGCGLYDYNWDGKPLHNVWVDTTYNSLTIDAPVEIDVDVWGVEAGGDIQYDLNNKLGIFVSYRQGDYEMDGKGDKFFSHIGSELNIDSYLAGLYYRYDNNNWYTFATLYGGMQKAEVSTNDGISNYDTDGIEFGGSAEVGYSYTVNNTLSLTPSLGIFYSQVNYDDATDNLGQTVEYDDLRQIELDAGVKVAHTQYTDDGFYSLYVKPSVVQTLADGDEIKISGSNKVDTVEDQTLGRIEIGGNYGFNDNWSAYGWASYTFGSDYKATSLGAGVNYAW